MPNFVPAVRLFTTTNWFDLTAHCDDRVFSNREMLAISGEIQQAKQLLCQFEDCGLYRPGEVDRLRARLNQLEAMLPTQDYIVPVPYENILGGSDIFVTGTSQLSPRLLSWYGEPAEAGKESTIFVYGIGFSVHETQVIAGGVPILGCHDAMCSDKDAKSSPRALLMSPNLMRLTIPANARPVKTEYGDDAIDVHVATPYGISNHLLVEIPSPEPKGNAGQSCAYTLSSDRIKASYIWDGCKIKVVAVTPCILKGADCSGIVPTRATLETNFNSVKVNIGPVDVKSDISCELVNGVTQKLNDCGLFTPAVPPAEFKSTAVAVTPSLNPTVSTTFTPLKLKMASLTIEYVPVSCNPCMNSTGVDDCSCPSCSTDPELTLGILDSWAAAKPATEKAATATDSKASSSPSSATQAATSPTTSSGSKSDASKPSAAASDDSQKQTGITFVAPPVQVNVVSPPPEEKTHKHPWKKK